MDVHMNERLLYLVLVLFNQAFLYILLVNIVCV